MLRPMKMLCDRAPGMTPLAGRMTPRSWGSRGDGESQGGVEWNGIGEELGRRLPNLGSRTREAGVSCGVGKSPARRLSARAATAKKVRVGKVTFGSGEASGFPAPRPKGPTAVFHTGAIEQRLQDAIAAAAEREIVLVETKERKREGAMERGPLHRPRERDQFLISADTLRRRSCIAGGLFARRLPKGHPAA